jgi:hypothetical protein
MREGEDPAGRTTRTLEEFLARVGPASSDYTDELDAAAVKAFEAFAAAGVDPVLLKGPGLARLLYTAEERRTYSDVDVLVAPRDLTQARETLERLGYRNATDVLGIDDVGAVVHEESWVGVNAGSQRELLIELHLRMAGSEAPPEAAWDALSPHRTWIDLRGRRMPVLDLQGSAMHLATHAAQHGPGYIKGCRELALGLERWPFAIWRGAARLAAEIEATEAFAAGMRLVPAGSELARTLGLPATDRLDWEIRHSGARPRGTFHLRALLEAQGLRARTRVVRRSLLPPRRWIEWQFPWARASGRRLLLAYLIHIARTPEWTARAWWFWRRAKRSAG